MLMFLYYVISYLFLVKAYSFDEFNTDLAKEMVEDGRNQYQLLQERGKLPEYGECWTSAVEFLNEGCRFLSEEVQSDIALRLTNCFLQMSGHETYNCDFDKKPNLRGICINSMTDRAFNVYTEFYTHAQNICWFLRGQVWQEKITKRTFELGDQLKQSIIQQDQLLNQQKESLIMEKELLQYGKSLEKVLHDSKVQANNILEDIRVSTSQHHQLLSVMTNSLSGLQSWLIGEISWFDSLIFYLGGTFIIVVITSTSRTASARLPLLITLSMNIILERTICDQMKFNLQKTEIHELHNDLNKYIWWCRRFVIVACILILIIQIYFYRDYNTINNALLLKIQQQNATITQQLEKINSPKITYEDKYNIIHESSFLRQSAEPEIVKSVIPTYYKSFSDTVSNTSKQSLSTSSSFTEPQPEVKFIHKRLSVSSNRDMMHTLNRQLHNLAHNHINDENSNSSANSVGRKYNLRSRQVTPVSNIR